MTVIATGTSERCNEISDATYRIAIVGGGPRALHAVDSLQQVWTSSPYPRQIAITVFEPTPFPGAGAVYDPRQPVCLRMNYPSHRISAWTNTCVDGPPRLSFTEWAAASGQLAATSNDFAPRSLVGEYLSACFEQLVDHSPTNVSCVVERQKVERVWPTKHSARVQTPDGEEHFDEAIITTGHGVLPFNQLNPRRLAKKTVAIRGFALTAIDTILSLTEGVGGRFQRADEYWTYRRSGAEPRTMAPFSLTGKPLYAKPCQSTSEAWSAFDGWTRHARALSELQSRHGDLDFASDILPVVATAAEDFLGWVTPTPDDSSGLACRSYLLGLPPGGDVEDPLEVWKSSYAVAVGRSAPNAPLAVAEAWRVLYPQLARLVSHGGLAPASYSEWRRTAVAMERLAFGPPAESIGRLVALVEAGLLNLDLVRNPTVETGHDGIRLRTETGHLHADELVHAVINSPSANARSGVIGGLLSDGHVSFSSTAGGVKVDRYGRPLEASPEGHRRLRIFGRATEGWIIGNDTLNRELHPEIAAWAAELANTISFDKQLQ